MSLNDMSTSRIIVWTWVLCCSLAAATGGVDTVHASSRVDVPSQPTASQQTELSRHERLLFRRNNEVLTHAGLATPNAELALVDQDNDQDAYLASYQWTIADYHGRSEKRLDSNVFRAGAALWQLILYPNGDEGHKGYISLYIGATLAPHWGPKEGVLCSWRFTIINMRGKRPHVVQEAQHNFTQYRTNWGFNKLVLRTALLDSGEGWLDAQGALLLRVDVRQVVPHWAEYAGVERQHFDTVRSSAALAAELAARGVSDLALSLAISEDGRSSVGYTLRGRVYHSAAELRAALAASSEPLRAFFASSAAAATLGDPVWPLVMDGSNASGAGGLGVEGREEAGAAGTAATAPHASGGGTAHAPPAADRGSGSGGSNAEGAAQQQQQQQQQLSRYSSLTALGINIDAVPASGVAGAFGGGGVGGAGGLLRSGSSSGPGGALSDLVEALAARLSLLGAYVTTPMAVGGVAYLAVAVAFQLRSWGRSIAALLSRGGKHKDKHAHAKPGVNKGRQLKTKARSNSSGRHHDAVGAGSSSGGAGAGGSSGGGSSGGGASGAHGSHAHPHAHPHPHHVPASSPTALSPSNSQGRRTAAAAAAAATAAATAALSSCVASDASAAAAAAADRMSQTSGGGGRSKASMPGDSTARADSSSNSSSMAQPPAAAAPAPPTQTIGGPRARSGGGAAPALEAGAAASISTSITGNGPRQEPYPAAAAMPPLSSDQPSQALPRLPPLTGSGAAVDTPAWLPQPTSGSSAAAVAAVSITGVGMVDSAGGAACGSGGGAGSTWAWQHPSDQRAFLGARPLLGLGLGLHQDGLSAARLLAAAQPNSAPQPFFERRLNQQLSGGGAGGARLAGSGGGVDGAECGSLFSPPMGLLSRSYEGCAAALGLGPEAPLSLALYGDDSSRGASGNMAAFGAAVGDDDDDDEEADGSIPAWVANSLLDEAAREEEEQQERLARSGSGSRGGSARGVGAVAVAALAAMPGPAEPSGAGSAPVQGRSRAEAGSGGGGQKKVPRAQKRGKAGVRCEAQGVAAAAAPSRGSVTNGAHQPAAEAVAVPGPAGAPSAVPKWSPPVEGAEGDEAGTASVIDTAAAAAVAVTADVADDGAAPSGAQSQPATEPLRVTSSGGISGWARAVAPLLRTWQAGGLAAVLISAAGTGGGTSGQDGGAAAAGAGAAAGASDSLLAAESVFDGLQRQLCKRLAVALVAAARGMLALAAQLVADDDGAAGAAAGAGAGAPEAGQGTQLTPAPPPAPAAQAAARPAGGSEPDPGTNAAGRVGGGGAADLCDQDQVVDPPLHLARRGGGRSVAPGPISLPATAHASVNGSGGGAGPAAASAPLAAALGSLAAATSDAWGSTMSITGASTGSRSRVVVNVGAAASAGGAIAGGGRAGHVGGALWSGGPWSQPHSVVSRSAGGSGGGGGSGAAAGGGGSRAAELLAMGVQLGLGPRPLREEPRCQLCLRNAPECGFVHADSICVAACFGCAQQLAAPAGGAAAAAPLCCPFCSKAIISVLAVHAVAQ
ncbi:hypothetical protein CHLRE_06g278131v5 [Chlamydomonas reinhardtii]|uniref:MATH domain-containing protein n=1 Tax=Chlamydomonas reinhardtii TaxID=3055 RepID=A0A2K3DNY8_CHLRE|nr:uncharacterized protein CHLRE_06g278131v5 [Chlamydomonas reinhardtii]PNW82241.1 hypothetical protein CHLRE_06g278131v5 [Chlamydomonas reinhardtii]